MPTRQEKYLQTDKGKNALQRAVRKYNYMKKYGITIDEYNDIFNEQNGFCKICERHQSEFKHRLSVDHCHSTGKIRGLLCRSCNRGIGYLGDSIELLKNAIDYLS